MPGRRVASLLLALACCVASQEEERTADAGDRTAGPPWFTVLTLLALLVGGYLYIKQPPAKPNPFLDKKKKVAKPKQPEPASAPAPAPEQPSDSGDVSAPGGTEGSQQKRPAGGGAASGTPDKPTGNGDKPEKSGAMSGDKPTNVQHGATSGEKPSDNGMANNQAAALFKKLDGCPTFTLVTKQGEFAAGPDGKARFFVAFEEAMAQLNAIRARGGVELLLHVVGLGRAIAAASQGKGLLVGRKEDAELARSLPVKEGEAPWTEASGLPLFYSPVMMLNTPDGRTVKPLFVDGADGSTALEDAKAQVAKGKAEVPPDALRLHVVPLSTIMQMMMDGKVKHSVIQPPSRSLKAIAEITASAQAQAAQAGAPDEPPPPPPPPPPVDGVISGTPPPEMVEVD